MDKVIYLIRHGKTDKSKLNKGDNEILGNNELDLDESFFPKIEELSEKLKLYEVKNAYTSDFLRTKRTAKILCRCNDVIVDSRLGERIGGTPNLNITPQEYYKMQIDNENFKFPNGESVCEIRERMSLAITDILNQCEEAVVVSHGAAITFLLTKWCKVSVIDVHKKIRRFEFRGNVIHEGVVNFVQCFKLIFDENNNIKDIQVI